ncbi:MAG: FAS1-like dehydratase domain-containing protein [Mycobacteriales bacterium]
MPINREFVGRSYEAGEVYEVGREAIRQFAEAIGDPNPAYRDPQAARALGHPDVIAPPTFLTVLNFRFALSSPVVDPELGLDYSRVVHGEQRYVHHRPVRAGDRLLARTVVESIRDAGRNELMTLRTEVSSESGEQVATAYSTIVSRGTAGGEA